MGEAAQELNGVQKAAILLITLGPEKSSEIFKHLKEDEIEELTLEIANTRSVSPDIKDEVINEFYQVCLAQQYIAEGGIGYAKELLEKALGDEQAQQAEELLFVKRPLDRFVVDLSQHLRHQASPAFPAAYCSKSLY